MYQYVCTSTRSNKKCASLFVKYVQYRLYSYTTMYPRYSVQYTVYQKHTNQLVESPT